MYRTTTKIGSGTYSKVFKLEGHPDLVGKLYTSECKNEPCIDEDFLLRELILLKRLGSHPRIVALHDVELSTHRVLLVLPKYPSVLKPHFYADRPAERKKIAKQLMDAVAHIHTHGVIHRDLKPDNILVDAQGDIVICDFNLAIQQGMDITKPKNYAEKAATLWWRAPEVLLTETLYDYKVDIWSVGVLLMSMCIERVVLRGTSEFDQLLKTYQLLGTPGSADVWPEARELPNFSKVLPQWRTPTLPVLLKDLEPSERSIVTHMVTYVDKRKSALWLLTHPYFQ